MMGLCRVLESCKETDPPRFFHPVSHSRVLELQYYTAFNKPAFRNEYYTIEQLESGLGGAFLLTLRYYTSGNHLNGFVNLSLCYPSCPIGRF